MRRLDRSEFERAKRLALAGIEAYRARAKLRKKPSAEELVQAMQEKAARGEAATEPEIGALAAAMAAQNTPKRGRGRPKGTQDRAAKSAFRAAYIATEACDLQRYRNSATGHRLTLCDALAEAMRESGFSSLMTYDAVAAKSKLMRRTLRCAAADLREVSERMKKMQTQIAGGLACVIPRMRAAFQIKLSSETLRAIEKHYNTKR